MLSWIEPDWPAPPGVRVISTLRFGGVSEGRYSSLNLGDHVEDEASRVAENRRLLCEAAALPAEPGWLAQVHGTAVADLDKPTRPQSADAAVTRQTGQVCAILTADCLPIALAAQSGEVVAAMHAGWRGLAAGSSSLPWMPCTCRGRRSRRGSDPRLAPIILRWALRFGKPF